MLTKFRVPVPRCDKWLSIRSNKWLTIRFRFLASGFKNNIVFPWKCVRNKRESTRIFKIRCKNVTKYILMNKYLYLFTKNVEFVFDHSSWITPDFISMKVWLSDPLFIVEEFDHRAILSTYRNQTLSHLSKCN